MIYQWTQYHNPIVFSNYCTVYSIYIFIKNLIIISEDPILDYIQENIISTCCDGVCRA